jgi:hypothetical protein
MTGFAHILRSTAPSAGGADIVLCVCASRAGLSDRE